MMNKNRILLLGLASLLAACNPAVSLRPLYQEEDVKNPTKDPRIAGEWISPEIGNENGDRPVDVKWKVSENSSGGYDVEMRAKAYEAPVNQVVTQYEVRLVPIGGKLFFDGEFKTVGEGEHAVERQNLALGVVPAHVIGQVLIEPDFLMLRLLGSSWIRDNKPENFREYVDMGTNKEVAVITGSTQELRQFVVQQTGGQAFEYFSFLCRPDADCVAASYEYLLKMDSSDEDIPRSLISHLLEVGNYSRAVELLRKDVEKDPTNAERRKALARALLLSREYEGARREFVRVQELTPGDSDAQQGIGWSQFLEGNFEQAAVSFGESVTFAEHKSVDSVLLTYISLKRSGKSAQAEALLSKETAEFKGVPADHLLLLLYGRRITLYPYEVLSEYEDKSRPAFFVGEFSLALGDRASALSGLWRSVEERKKDTLYGAAARVELERIEK